MFEARLYRVLRDGDQASPVPGSGFNGSSVSRKSVGQRGVETHRIADVGSSDVRPVAEVTSSS